MSREELDRDTRSLFNWLVVGFTVVVGELWMLTSVVAEDAPMWHFWLVLAPSNVWIGLFPYGTLRRVWTSIHGDRRS